ncbi:MAG: hypothetical protein LBG92_11595, partial [Prevotellaceae bacterium]|nr:hypothetical protein [Prevotellaceae bacterium]
NTGLKSRTFITAGERRVACGLCLRTARSFAQSGKFGACALPQATLRSPAVMKIKPIRAKKTFANPDSHYYCLLKNLLYFCSLKFLI